MNVEFFKEFGKTNPTLPLKEAGKIVQGNATRLDWESVCPKNEEDEIYVLGNPPYLGFNLQDTSQRSDMEIVFAPRKNWKRLDYICCWFQKGGRYIAESNANLAFVSTNSICQGEQVNLLWPNILKDDLEIGFAHQPFKWSNNARGGAGVTCVIVGLRQKSNLPKYLFSGDFQDKVLSINAYLTAGSDVIVAKRGNPISDIPEMLRGDMPIDGGNLILSLQEKESLIKKYPESIPLVREFVGADEFLKGKTRWCLWISNNDLKLVKQIPPISRRLELVGRV